MAYELSALSADSQLRSTLKDTADLFPRLIIAPADDGFLLYISYNVRKSIRDQFIVVFITHARKAVFFKRVYGKDEINHFSHTALLIVTTFRIRICLTIFFSIQISYLCVPSVPNTNTILI